MTPFRRAAIVAVGSELLTSSKLDTNSLHITEQLNRLGIDVVLKSVVGDSRDELTHMIRALLERVDLLILCGGLGPTDDDITREAVSAALERPLSEDEGITARLRERFKARGFAMPMPEINRRQAMVPAGAIVIENSRGSAPGLWIDHGARSVVLLPGPPRELKPMLASLVDGRLRDRASGESLVRRVVRIAGRIESDVDQVLQPLYHQWADASPPIAATILAAPGAIELHLSARASSSAAADAALDPAVREVVKAIGEDVYSTDGRTLERVVGDLLVNGGLRIAAAESCTGGLITSRLTDVPGSSRYVDQSVITYANAAKTELLGVPPEMIEAHGAVSEPVALAMAEGIRTRRAPTLASASRESPGRPEALPRSRSARSSSRRSRHESAAVARSGSTASANS